MKITLKNKEVGGWVYTVEIDTVKYEVTVDKEYWEKLTGKNIPVEDLIQESFKFLLQRESKEIILKSFNLKEISTYFPEYERVLFAKKDNV